MTVLSAILLVGMTSGLFSYAAPDPIDAETSAGSTMEEDSFIELDQLPEVIVKAAPEYPEAARKSGVEGDVWIKTFVNLQGTPTKTRIFRSSGSESLDRAALIAAEKCVYKPAEVEGKPVGCWVTYKIRFLL
jgi:TonB family protein